MAPKQVVSDQKISEMLDELALLEKQIASPDQNIEDAIAAYAKAKVLVETLLKRLAHVEKELHEIEVSGVAKD